MIENAFQGNLYILCRSPGLFFSKGKNEYCSLFRKHGSLFIACLQGSLGDYRIYVVQGDYLIAYFSQVPIAAARVLSAGYLEVFLSRDQGVGRQSRPRREQATNLGNVA